MSWTVRALVVPLLVGLKGCSGAEGDDRDQGDDQACWNATRRESARRLATWLDRDPTRSAAILPPSSAI